MKEEKKTVFGIVILTLLCVVILVSATEIPTPYSLSGHILDSNMQPIIGAEITITNTRTGDSLELESVINGEYQENAGNFLPNRYQNGDTLEYSVSFEDIKKVVYAEIDETNGGTLLDIRLDKKSSKDINVMGFEFPIVFLLLFLTFLYIRKKQTKIKEK